MLVAYIYVVPPLTSRLEQQKLKDQELNASLIGNTVAGSGVVNLGNGEMGIGDADGLQRTITLARACASTPVSCSSPRTRCPAWTPAASAPSTSATTRWSRTR